MTLMFINSKDTRLTTTLTFFSGSLSRVLRRATSARCSCSVRLGARDSFLCTIKLNSMPQAGTSSAGSATGTGASAKAGHSCVVAVGEEGDGGVTSFQSNFPLS